MAATELSVPPLIPNNTRLFSSIMPQNYVFFRCELSAEAVIFTLKKGYESIFLFKFAD
ncbi:hypothetical protein JCM10003_232 [Bacteroides pyogenes JCM 10003]|nr:hypothetical protein JCM10003_232 [Bacteroides pyogenes JCM 10003]